MEADGTHILKLEHRQPGTVRLPHAGRSRLRHGATSSPTREGYSPSKGLFSARKAIMQYAQLKNIPERRHRRHLHRQRRQRAHQPVHVRAARHRRRGARALAGLPAVDRLREPGRRHRRCTTCATSSPNGIRTSTTSRSKITSNTKAIVIINPNNPTGALYPKRSAPADRRHCARTPRPHDLLSDEIYDRLVMDGLEHISIASLAPDLFCVTFSGLSKSHMIAGYRIGWMIFSRQHAHCAKDFLAWPQHARQHAFVLERARTVRGADRARRPSERE